MNSPTPRTPERRLHDFGDGYIAFTVTCKRCNGKGYHHGFGEHGHDPDWCSNCGGPGFDYENLITPWET